MSRSRLFIIVVAFCAAFSVSRAAEKIDFIPQPVSVEYLQGQFTMDRNIVISGGDAWNASYLKKHLDKVFDFDVRLSSSAVSGPSISFEKCAAMAAEEYSIEVNGNGVTVKSSGRAGEFYAIQTILQMMPAEVYRDVTNKESGLMLKSWKLPFLRISDKPRFEYRGSMFDVSRTFFSKEYMLRHLDFIAYHKINKLHWHLVDDNGWRIEIKKYPKLTQVGAWRGKDCALPPAYNSGSEPYGGYYTQDDIREIVKYASERNIEIIPEIDLPGHSRSIAVSYPEILCNHDKDIQSVQGEVKNVFCVGKESNYKILENIFKEIAALFPSQYINIGGDEVATSNWKYCPDCQAVMKKMGYTSESQLLGYFVNRLDKIVHKLGKKMGGWHDIVVGDISGDDLVVAWKSKNAMDALNKGFRTVMQPAEYCYMDMKYTLPERGHTWAAIVSTENVYSLDPTGTFPMTDEQKKLVVGPQAGLWTEMLFFPPHFSEYQMFPRLCALSEVGWTPQEQRVFADFDKRLNAAHIERLWNIGIRFRIPYPEVKVLSSRSDDQGRMVFARVSASVPYENMVVRYTVDGSEPSLSSPVLSGEIASDCPQNLRFATFYNDVRSIPVEVPSCHTYLKPETKVTTSFTANRYSSVENLEKYDFSKYLRTEQLPKKGDFVLYEFAEPVCCSTITVQTNDPVNEFFGITEGHVEYSYDGREFIDAGTFDIHNRVVISNISKSVKAVKILVDGDCEQKQVSIQCLKIER